MGQLWSNALTSGQSSSLFRHRIRTTLRSVTTLVNHKQASSEQLRASTSKNLTDSSGRMPPHWTPRTTLVGHHPKDGIALESHTLATRSATSGGERCDNTV